MSSLGTTWLRAEWKLQLAPKGILMFLPVALMNHVHYTTGQRQKDISLYHSYFTVASQHFVSHHREPHPSLTHHKALSCSFFCTIPAPQSIFLVYQDFYCIWIKFYSLANQRFKCHLCLQFLPILFLWYISALYMVYMVYDCSVQRRWGRFLLTRVN